MREPTGPYPSVRVQGGWPSGGLAGWLGPAGGDGPQGRSGHRDIRGTRAVAEATGRSRSREGPGRRPGGRVGRRLSRGCRHAAGRAGGVRAGRLRPNGLPPRVGMSSSAAMRLSASTSPWWRAQVVSCSRPGRTGETQIGQPSGVAMTCTFPPWCLCFPDHQRSAPLGPGAATRSVRMTVTSRFRCVSPAAFARSSAVDRSGAPAARTASTSWR